MIVLNVQYKQEHHYVQPFIVMGNYQSPGRIVVAKSWLIVREAFPKKLNDNFTQLGLGSPAN